MSNRKWDTPEKIVGIYNDYKQELGRRPTYEDFRKKHGGALNAIILRKVITNVNTWNGFLRYIGEEVNYDRKMWDTAGKIIQAYIKFKKEKRKVPNVKEFIKRYGSGVIDAINKEKVPNVTSWNDFLRYMGDKPRQQTKKDSISLLESLLEDSSEGGEE